MKPRIWKHLSGWYCLRVKVYIRYELQIVTYGAFQNLQEALGFLCSLYKEGRVCR